MSNKLSDDECDEDVAKDEALNDKGDDDNDDIVKASDEEEENTGQDIPKKNFRKRKNATASKPSQQKRSKSSATVDREAETSDKGEEDDDDDDHQLQRLCIAVVDHQPVGEGIAQPMDKPLIEENSPSLDELHSDQQHRSSQNEGGDDGAGENEGSKIAISPLDELLELQGKTDLDVNEISARLMVGDTVEVIEGDNIGMQGKLISLDGSTVKVKPHSDSIDSEETTEVQFVVGQVRKYFQVGTKVKVTDGRYANETGVVVATELLDGDYDFTAVVLTDATNQEISVWTSQLREWTESAAIQDSLQGYELFDLVVLSGGNSANEVGVIVRVGREDFTVINNHGIPREVRPEELRGKRNSTSTRAVALDVKGNLVRCGDKVSVAEGSHKGKSATIKRMSLAQLFLHSQTHAEHAGVFVVRSRSCSLIENVTVVTNGVNEETHEIRTEEKNHETLINNNSPQQSSCVTRTEDKIFSSMFSETQTSFEHLRQLDVAVDRYEEKSGFRIIIRKSDEHSRTYKCGSHIGCCFRAKFGKIRNKEQIVLKTQNSILYHCGPAVPPKAEGGRAHKRRLKGRLDSIIHNVAKVKDGNPLPKDVMKAANLDGISTTYNQSFRAIRAAIPSTKQASGPPKKIRLRKRSRFAHEPEKSNIVCSRCRQRGHNVRTCLAREALAKSRDGQSSGTFEVI